AKMPTASGTPRPAGGVSKSTGGPAATTAPSGSPPVSAGTGTAAPATAAPAPAEPLLTAAAFKKAGREARLLVTGIRASAGVSRRATRARKLRQAATARATAERRLRSLEILVRQYEQA